MLFQAELIRAEGSDLSLLIWIVAPSIFSVTDSPLSGPTLSGPEVILFGRNGYNPNHTLMKRFIRRANILFFSALLSFTIVGEAKADAVETAGSIVQLLLPAGAAALTYDRQDSDGFVQLAESGLLTLGVTYGLKYAIPETRPNGGKHSFPSGHTSTSFAAAEFIRARYGAEYGIPAYLAASFVGYSRVEAKEHYTRDVITGAAVGIVSANVFTTHNKNWNVRAETGHSSYGIGITALF